MNETALNSLGPDLIELILSHLPILSVIRATSVCKSWNSIIRSRAFKTNRLSDSNSLPWFFIYTHHGNTSHAFAFDPESGKWIKLPDSGLPFEESLISSNSLLFSTSPENFSFKRVFSKTWRHIAPLRFSSCKHFIGVYDDPGCSNLTRFIVVAVDLEGYIAVNIYNPRQNAWELCPPPPQLFSHEGSSDLLSLTFFRNKFYISGNFSGFVSSFDLERGIWSDARSLRPPCVIFSFLVSCQDQLVLAGWSNENDKPCRFHLWSIDERTLEYREIGVMPDELLYSLFVEVHGETKIIRLNCVGSGNLVYVFSEDHEACMCEISSSLVECKWRRIPGLPEPVSRLQRGNSFCSHVSVQDILGNVRSD